MKVNAYCYRQARKKEENTAEIIVQEYLKPTGYEMRETMSYQTKSDFTDTTKCRYSSDNGETWSDWELLNDENDENLNQGEHKMLLLELVPPVYNKVHKHYIKIFGRDIHIGGYDKANEAYWKGDFRDMRIHSYITVTDENGASHTDLIKYEEGLDFNPENWFEPGFIDKNSGLVNGNVIIDDNGDILLLMEVYTYKCCELSGRDVKDYIPDAPYATTGILLLRGVWNGSSYEFTSGEPIIINDALSSRGVVEPCMAKLKNGRIVVVMRGSNAQMGWKTRILPGAPGFKWFSYSDDNGKTFSPVVPWHFDNGEAVYSSSTFSRMFYHEETGKYYWIGNITDHTAYGNSPRYPLNIVEIDETNGTAKKDTLTVIDTRRENDAEDVQLSNFAILHNRKTGNLEIILSKICQFDYQLDFSNVFQSEVWKYEISFD